MWITALTNRQPLQVVLVHDQKVDFGVVCQPTDGHWEALYAVRPNEKVELPACFSLSDEAKEALDKFMDIQGL